jgi:hypothetical protein
VIRGLVDRAREVVVDKRFDVVLVADGHTTWDNALLDGAAAIAYQNMLLRGFGTPDHEVAVVPGAEIRF